MIIPVEYGVWFGPGDSSDWIEAEMELNEAEQEAFQLMRREGYELPDTPGLEDAVKRFLEEVQADELETYIDLEDAYVMECLGKTEVDADEINSLVAARDSHALEFFHLETMSEEELDAWDAHDVDLPDVCDFEKDFTPLNPFEEGWQMNIQLGSIEVSEDEIKEDLRYLFKTYPDDFSQLEEYIWRMEDDYGTDYDVEELAKCVAEEMHITGYLSDEE